MAIRILNPATSFNESSISNRRYGYYGGFNEADEAPDAEVSDELLDKMENILDELEDALAQETRFSYKRQGIEPNAAKVKMYQKLEKLRRRSDRLDGILHAYHSKLNRMNA